MTIIDYRDLPSRNGFDLTVSKHYDEDSHTNDYDCYTPKQVAAWQANEWEFVGLVVTASISDIELGTASLWSIENGMFVCTDEDDNVTETRDVDPMTDNDYLEDLISEAIDNARDNLKAINEKAGQQ